MSESRRERSLTLVRPAKAGRHEAAPPQPPASDARHKPLIGMLCGLADAGAVAVTGGYAGLVGNEPGMSMPAGAAWAAGLAATLVAFAVLGWTRSRTLDRLLFPFGKGGGLIVAMVAGAMTHGALTLVLAPQGMGVVALRHTVVWAALASAGLLAWRLLLAARLSQLLRAGRLARTIAVIGSRAASRGFVERSAACRWTRVAGVFDDASDADGTVADLLQASRTRPVDAVLIALPDANPAELAVLRRRLGEMVADVALASPALRQANGTEPVSMLAGSPVLLLDRRPMGEWGGLAKGAFDRSAAALMLLLALPLMLLIALAVRLDSRGPALFRQEREGFNNRPFTMFKFRTMRHDRPGADEWMQATRTDPRVTRLGAVLRRLSLDELPQLLNVLRGDMSLVGPRPHLASTRAGERLFRDVVPSYAARHRVKPGITGWAQVNGMRGETRTERHIAERVALDLEYIESWSFGRDLRILWMTLANEIVSRSGNAY